MSDFSYHDLPETGVRRVERYFVATVAVTIVRLRYIPTLTLSAVLTLRCLPKLRERIGKRISPETMISCR
jgi:hypothetical protein